MRGRYPYGPEYVDQLQGSEEAKKRAKIILQTITGELRVQEACEQLGICEQRLGQLRQEMLQAAVSRLETQPAGRKPAAVPSPEVAALKEQLATLEEDLHAAQVREEIALALKNVVHEPVAPKPAAQQPGEKKNGRDRGA
jgi:transposase-like protein